MTYCVGVTVQDGLVMLSDTRTNAGVDNVATFGKMTVWQNPGDRVIALCTSGNLAISQEILHIMEEGLPVEPGGEPETPYTVPTMFRCARLISRALRSVYHEHGPTMKSLNTDFVQSLLLGGQVGSGPLRLFRFYSAGNFIETSRETPFLQIGEHKYGKPILDRTLDYGSSLDETVKACLVSMDSTLRSNLSVGLPMDLMVYRRDSLGAPVHRRIEENDEYFLALQRSWSSALRDAYNAMENPDWLE